jgi:hypothetical protein
VYSFLDSPPLRLSSASNSRTKRPLSIEAVHAALLINPDFPPPTSGARDLLPAIVGRVHGAQANTGVSLSHNRDGRELHAYGCRSHTCSSDQFARGLIFNNPPCSTSVSSLWNGGALLSIGRVVILSPTRQASPVRASTAILYGFGNRAAVAESRGRIS